MVTGLHRTGTLDILALSKSIKHLD